MGESSLATGNKSSSRLLRTCCVPGVVLSKQCTCMNSEQPHSLKRLGSCMLVNIFQFRHHLASTHPISGDSIQTSVGNAHHPASESWALKGRSGDLGLSQSASYPHVTCTVTGLLMDTRPTGLLPAALEPERTATVPSGGRACLQVAQTCRKWSHLAEEEPASVDTV